MSWKEKQLIGLVLFDGRTQSEAWRMLNPRTTWKRNEVVWSSASRAFRKAMRKAEKFPFFMEAAGIDNSSLARKLKALLDAKKLVSGGGSGAMVEVTDNATQLAALELALRKRFPDPAPGGGFGININRLEGNFVIGHPGKTKDDAEWEKEARNVIAPPLAPQDGTQTQNNE